MTTTILVPLDGSELDFPRAKALETRMDKALFPACGGDGHHPGYGPVESTGASGACDRQLSNELSRVVLGSIAGKVQRKGATPLDLLRPPGGNGM